jgi:alkylated DNA repair dioxygenase AlkB
LNIKKLVENILDEQFNSGLVNFYRNGDDSMGWHADDERELGPNPIIASANFGATRKMKFKELGGGQRKIDVILDHGDILVMGGALQHHWQHMVPKQDNVKEPRLNITFRNIIES